MKWRPNLTPLWLLKIYINVGPTNCIKFQINIQKENIKVRVHTSCARIHPLCATLPCLAYSRWMAPSELRSKAPCRRARAAAASLAELNSTKATGPVLPPLPPLSRRSRANPGQLRDILNCAGTRTPVSFVFIHIIRFLRLIFKNMILVEPFAIFFNTNSKLKYWAFILWKSGIVVLTIDYLTIWNSVWHRFVQFNVYFACSRWIALLNLSSFIAIW